MKRRLPTAALPPALVLLLASCTPKTELRMAVEVVSDPGAAKVTFRGKALGATPAAVDVKTFDELMSIAASRDGAPLAEKRIRILSPEKAQLVFRFGSEASAVAKKLGLSNVLVFDYSEKVAFDSGRSELKPDGLPILNKQAEILAKYFPKLDVYVCGHTDSTGGEELNLKLSLDRARVVSDYLVARGVPKDRLRAQGFGKDFPNDTNDTPEGRSNNRRTELILPQ